MDVVSGLTNDVISRRRFMRLTGAGLAVGAIGLPLLLEACSTPAPATTSTGGLSTAAGGSAAKPADVAPSFIPFANKPKPDFPSSGGLYEDGYINYPKDPAKLITTPPGSGGTVNAMTIGLFPPPTPYDQNAAWQEINKQLNVDFKFNIVAPGDYQAKLATVMAGNDLPDLLFFYYNGQTAITSVAGVPQFLQAACADLTPYLAGDAAKNYPNLAAIPTAPWKNSGSVYNGKVQMVPKPLYPEGFVFLKNSVQWAKAVGADTVPKNADDFKRIMQALNRPQENFYAYGASPMGAFGIQYFSALFGAPNQWSLGTDGKLTKAIETPQYKQAVSFMHDMWAGGLFHPNSGQYSSGVVARGDFAAGKWAIWIDGFSTAWSDSWRRARTSSNPFEVYMIPPFSAVDGQKPQHFLNAAHLGATAIKKGDPTRVKELLSILNYLAAPFGTWEERLLSYGVEGTDYNLDPNGNPVLTDKGNPDANYLPFKYVAQRPAVIYLPDIPDFAKIVSDAEKQLLPIGVADPTVGHVSPTSLTKGVVLDQGVSDATVDIIVGRRPLTDWDQVVKDWQSGGGETIRGEYQNAIATNSA